jgi:hypothetical protein
MLHVPFIKAFLMQFSYQYPMKSANSEAPYINFLLSHVVYSGKFIEIYRMNLML